MTKQKQYELESKFYDFLFTNFTLCSKQQTYYSHKALQNTVKFERCNFETWTHTEAELDYLEKIITWLHKEYYISLKD